MRPADHVPLPPLIFPATTRAERRWLAELKVEGRIRSIGPRLYASVPEAKVAAAVRGSWSTIVSRLFPDALLSHRSALEYRPSPDGEIFLTAGTNRVVTYPGLRLVFLRGPGPLPDDPRFLTMRASSRPRAFLENLSSARGASARRRLPIEDLEARLEQILRVGGDAELVALRRRARAIARQLGWDRAAERLDERIGALLGSRPGTRLTSAVARARAAREPFDPACLERLQLLFGELRGRSLPALVDRFAAPDHVTNKAFFEAYFSNYIEGTRFEIEEAEAIVFDKKIPARRPKDAHDIVGTHQLVSDLAELRTTPRSFDDLVERLQSRHRTLLGQRPEVSPGRFKEKPNRAGDTVFVAPADVLGTLRKGFELYTDLTPGLPRAAFLMFLVAEVHPFVDGNGRLARVMMTSELVAAGAATIIIPTVYRDDYLLSLRALTRRHRPAPLVDMLLKAQRFSHLEFSPYPRILKELERRNWFREPDEARIVD